MAVLGLGMVAFVGTLRCVHAAEQNEPNDEPMAAASTKEVSWVLRDSEGYYGL